MTDDAYPIAHYDAANKCPIWNGIPEMSCRTIHGPATVFWSKQSLGPVGHVQNALVPDGKRENVASCMAGWRRAVPKPGKWVIGHLEITEIDVIFHDHKHQPVYVPPNSDSLDRLERDLAACPAFVDALETDAFAVVAYGMLTGPEWFRLDTGEEAFIRGNRGIAAMIAGLRKKGESYLDFYCGEQAAVGRRTAAKHARRMNKILLSLGWRRRTEKEEEAFAKADFLDRVARRVACWKDMDRYGARPYGSFEPRELKIAHFDYILLSRDNPEWLNELKREEAQAASTQFRARLSHLATTGRLSEDEFKSLGRCYIYPMKLLEWI